MKRTLTLIGVAFAATPAAAQARIPIRVGIGNQHQEGAPALGGDARFDAGLIAPDGTPRAGYRYLQRALGSYER